MTMNTTSPWLTLEEAAAYVKLTKKTLQNYVSKRVVPFGRSPAGTLRFNVLELDSWLRGEWKK